MAVLLPLPLPAPLIWLREVSTVRGIPVTAHTLEVLVPGAGSAALSHGRHPFAGRKSRNRLAWHIPDLAEEHTERNILLAYNACTPCT